MNNYTDDELRELVLLQAKLYYYEGKSLREIAELTGQSHVTVKRNFDVRLKDYSFDLYDKIQEKLLENQPDSIEDENVCKRILTAYHLLVAEDKTIDEIASILNSTYFIIYRDLTKRLQMINKISPKLVTEEMLANVELTFKRHSNENAHPTKK